MQTLTGGAGPTPKDRIDIVLNGGVADKVPFGCYHQFLKKSELDRRMRELGMCYVHLEEPCVCLSGVTPSRQNCDETVFLYTDKATGESMKRVEIETPVGRMSSTILDRGYTQWVQDYMFKGAADYGALLSYINDTEYEADPNVYKKFGEEYGGDAFLMPFVGFSPLIDTVINWMDIEVFSYEWADNQSRMEELLEAMHQRDLRLIKAACKTDLPVISYCGNISPKIHGRPRIEKYVMPVINEMAEIVHDAGKLITTHLDDNCGVISDLVAESGIDIIEAFTPFPDTDMTVAQARAAWPEKTLWVNFPSSQHWCPDDVIADIVKRIIDENGGFEKLLFGITEDMPETEWRRSLLAIAEAIDSVRG